MKIVKRWTAKAKEQIIVDIISNKDILAYVFNYNDAFIYLEKLDEQMLTYEIPSTERNLAEYAKDIVAAYIDWFNLSRENITYPLMRRGYNTADCNIAWIEFLSRDIEEIKQARIESIKRYPELKHILETPYPPVDL